MSQEQILDLKRQAIALKESGDVNGAMVLLAQARDLEFENANIDDIWEPLKLKQFAVVMKKRGDLDAARQALMKAKQIEKDGLPEQNSAVPPSPQSQEPPEAPSQQQQPVSSSENTVPSEPPADPPAKEPVNTAAQAEVLEQSQVEEPAGEEPTVETPIQEAPQPPPPKDSDSKAADSPEEDDGELNELMQLDKSNNDNDDNTPVEVSYSIEEMMDQEMLIEFKTEGMPVPSEEEYQAKILECKKAALAAKKAGDTTRALKELQKSKQLERVRVALSQVQGGGLLAAGAIDDDDWMKNLSTEESTLMGELLMDGKPATSSEEPVDIVDTTGSSNNDGSIETALEELAGFLEEPALFMDAIEMGMEVPPLEDIEAKAEEYKQLAVSHKKAGDLGGAKAALLQAKKFLSYAGKIKVLQEQMERRHGGHTETANVQVDDLEAMLEAHENKAKETPRVVLINEPKENAAPAEKSSEALRQEAIQLRDQKKIKEAAEVLKLYKAALKREQDATEMKQRKEIVAGIQQEIEYAQKQIQAFEYHRRFVDGESQQVAKWKEYAARCDNASKIIMMKGSAAINISKKKGELVCARRTGDELEQNDFNGLLADLVGLGGDPSDDRLEITILGLDNVQENTNLQKLLKKQKRENLPHHPSTVRIEAHVQLPPNEHDTDNTIDMVYEPPSDALKKLELTTTEEGKDELPDSYPFDNSQYVAVERGNTAYGKIIRRRIERNKKVTFMAYHVPVAEKKGWLFSKKANKEELPPPTLLGKVVIELQGFLKRKCVAAGEYPLMNGSLSKELGGKIRLVVRTGTPFGTPEPGEGAELPETVLEQYEAMTFSLNQQPSQNAAEV